jgi:hypothetical protein
MCGDGRHFAQDCDYRPSNWPEWLRAEVKSKAKGQAVATPPAAMAGAGPPTQQVAMQQPAQQVVQAQLAPMAMQPQVAQVVTPPMQQPVAYQPLAQGGLAVASEGVGLPALRLLNEIVSSLAAPKGAVDQSCSGAKGQPGKGNFGKGKKKKKKQANTPVQGTSSEVGKASASAPTQPNQLNKEQGNCV